MASSLRRNPFIGSATMKRAKSIEL